jgi:hypothetical protein
MVCVKLEFADVARFKTARSSTWEAPKLFIVAFAQICNWHWKTTVVYQSNFILPLLHVPVGEVFYMRQVWLYIGVRNIQLWNHNCWPRPTAGKGSNTCLDRYLTSLPNEVNIHFLVAINYCINVFHTVVILSAMYIVVLTQTLAIMTLTADFFCSNLLRP